MGYQEIGEKIKVLAVFKNGTIFPHIFEWNNRRHKVDKVNLSYQEREGQSINYYFAVESGGLVAKLKYNDKGMDWSIEEVWVK
jgi:hypothetical protein